MLQFLSKSNIRRRQNLGLLSGVLAGLLIVGLLAHPDNAVLHSPGTINTGHENLLCEDCHALSEGSLRQKIQANLRYLLGERKNSIALGYNSVISDRCLECHDRPNDRHPIYRFFEPRFKKARDTIGAHQCNSCHNEHRGVRVSSPMDFCKVCHDNLSLKKDPLATPHKILVKNNRWTTCLGCHDFHGNHLMHVNDSMKDLISESLVQNYFDGENSPYACKKRYKARKRINNGSSS